MNNKKSITGKEFRKILVKRLNTQRRIVNLTQDDKVIIHPSFLKRIGVLCKKEVDEIKFYNGSLVNGIKDNCINEIDYLSINKENFIEVEINKEKTFLLGRNTLGKREEIKADAKYESVQSLLSIDHNPAVYIAVITLYRNNKIPSIIEFTKLLLKNELNLEIGKLKVKTLSKRGTGAAMFKVFNSLNENQKENIVKEYKNIFDEMEIEINAAYYNTSIIDLSSIQYFIKNNNKL